MAVVLLPNYATWSTSVFCFLLKYKNHSFKEIHSNIAGQAFVFRLPSIFTFIRHIHRLLYSRAEHFYIHHYFPNYFP